MSLFYKIIGIIIVCCALAMLIMVYIKPILSIPYKEYIFVFLCIVAIVLYISYNMLPERRIADSYKVTYSQPRSWEQCL